MLKYCITYIVHYYNNRTEIQRIPIMSHTLDPTRPIYIQIMEEIKKRTVRGQTRRTTAISSRAGKGNGS